MTTTERRATQEEQNKVLFRQFIEDGAGTGNPAIVDRFPTGDVTRQQPVGQEGDQGLDALIARLRMAFPNLTVTIEDMAAEGDKVWARLCGRGSHQGEFMDRPPTGKDVSVDIIGICRFEHGKIVEHWGLTDRRSLLEQLRIIPRPNRAPV